MNVLELMTDLVRLGIRLETDGERLRYSPRSAVAAGLADRLRGHKAEIIAILRPIPDVAPVDTESPNESHAEPVKQVCRCGSTTWQDVLIHDGQSTRRDCDRCGRFISFPIWYGRPNAEPASPNAPGLARASPDE
jgi:hypothetical protein